MTISADITRTVERFCQPPRARIVNNWDGFDLTDVRLGVVYLFAPWSAWSVQNLSVISAVMARPEFEHFDFVVVNIDTVPEVFIQATFGRPCPAGAGETLWIRDGEVVAASLGSATDRAGWEMETMLAEQAKRLPISAEE